MSDTSCAVFRWGSWTDVCRPTMVRWAIVVAVLVALGLALVGTGIKLAHDQRRIAS